MQCQVRFERQPWVAALAVIAVITSAGANGGVARAQAQAQPAPSEPPPAAPYPPPVYSPPSVQPSAQQTPPAPTQPPYPSPAQTPSATPRPRVTPRVAPAPSVGPLPYATPIPNAAQGQGGVPAPGTTREPGLPATVGPQALGGGSTEMELEAAGSHEPLSLSMFVDSYYNFDLNLPEGAMNANGVQAHRGYVRTQGFALSFVGLDAEYDGGSVGATANLRIGPSAANLIRLSDANQLGLGMAFLRQAFVTYKPMEMVTVDFGQFDTVYGSEGADTFANLNYTRGALPFLMQPLWHQGLRVAVAPTELLSVTALLVNGVNQAFDTDRGPDLGLQIGVTPSPSVGGALGYYASTQPDGKKWAHFLDLVLNASLDIVSVVFNADLGIADQKDTDEQSMYWGTSLAARLQVTEALAVAIRGEYLAEGQADDGYSVTDFADGYLATGTLTLELIPPDAQNFIFRLDTRVETSSDELFLKDATAVLGPNGGVRNFNSDTYVSAVLGMVVKTN